LLVNDCQNAASKIEKPHLFGRSNRIDQMINGLLNGISKNDGHSRSLQTIKDALGFIGAE